MNWILLLIFSSVVWASPCEEVMSTHMATVSFAGKPLVACAEGASGIVSDLTVIYDKKIVFESEAALKSYKVLTTKVSMFLDEGLAQTDFKPFIQRKFQCVNGKCFFMDFKCSWVKGKPDPEIVGEINKFKAKKLSIPDTAWERAFISALNGDQEALKFFGHQEDGEGFKTYKMDALRLQKLGCLPKL